jgi:hypothetical protein
MSKSKVHIRLDLENDPIIAGQMGNLCAGWAAVEYRVFVLYQCFMGGSTALNRAVFYSHHSTRNRLDLLKAVAKIIMQDANGDLLPEYKELEDLLTAINQTAGKRNKYVHDPWGSWDGAPAKLFQIRTGKGGQIAQAKAIAENDLKNVVSQVQKRDRELLAYQRKIAPQLSSLRRKLDRLPSLPLAFSKTEVPQEIGKEKPPRQRRS